MSDRMEAMKELKARFKDALRPPLAESVVNWVESNCDIPTGAIQGRASMALTPYLREPLERIGQKSTKHMVMVYGTQTGKALALDTPIPTPSGWTTVGDLRVGEEVFAGDGSVCRVTYKTEVFEDRECYRVEFGDGTSVVVDAGHLWKVRRDFRRWDGVREFRESGVSEVVETTQLRAGVRCPHRIDVAGPIQTKDASLPVDPYSLGVWLGDGKTTAAVFWQDERDFCEIADQMRSGGVDTGVIAKEGERTLRVSIKSGFWAALKSLGVAGNKHIPNVYLRASADQRARLLMGLMDTDWTCCKDGTEASFCTTLPVMRDGVFELAASLGFKPRIKSKVARIQGRDCGMAYMVSFHPDGRNVFALRRKQQRVQSRKRDQFRGHEIVSVKKVDTVPVQCIAVDFKDHTFLCGKSMIPTHNTSVMQLGMLYRLARDPQDAMWVLPNGELAKSFSKSRWQKFVRACPAAAAMVPRSASGEFDKHLFGFMEQHFSTMVLNFVGSNSPANLSSRPVGLLWMDETDKYGDESKFEAAAIKLAEERTKTYPFPLVVKSSTPTLANRMIWTEFLKTDQRYYMLPCPRCERRIRLLFTVRSQEHGECGVRWWRESEEESKTDGAWDMEKVAMNAFYRCQECGGEIQDIERQSMLNEGIWAPTNPQAAPGWFGYQLSSIYSILSQQTSLSAVAIQFLTSKGLVRDMQNFINSWLAEPWDESRGYDHKEVPLEDFSTTPENSVPLMAVDAQEGHYWVLVRKFSPPGPDKLHGESWLVFADRVDTEDDIKKLQIEYGVADENVTVDMANRPNAVGRIILEYGWRGVWGSNTKEFYHPGPNGTRQTRIYSQVQFRDPLLGTAWENRTAQRVRYVKFSKSGALDLVSSLRYADPVIWHASINVSDRYQRHLNSRVKRQQKNKRNGRVEWTWVELHQENHLADCESHVAIRALQLGLLSMPGETSAANVRG